jgi:hypothetical protein
MNRRSFLSKDDPNRLQPGDFMPGPVVTINWMPWMEGEGFDIHKDWCSVCGVSVGLCGAAYERMKALNDIWPLCMSCKLNEPA